MNLFDCHCSCMGKLPVTVAKADTFLKRLRGLAYSDRTDRALWIVPCSSIHTFWMRFDLHVLFVDIEGKVLKVIPNLPPRRWASCKSARYVLEIPAGLLAEDQLPGEGSWVSIRPRSR